MYSRIEIHIDRGAAPQSVTMIGNKDERETTRNRARKPRASEIVETPFTKIPLMCDLCLLCSQASGRIGSAPWYIRRVVMTVITLKFLLLLIAWVMDLFGAL